MADESVDVQQKTFNVAEMGHVPAPGFAHIYANNASFGITFFDFSITFGQILSPNPNSMQIEDRVSVTMSLEHAKALGEAIQTMIANYEKTHGPVRKTPSADKI